MDDFNPSAAASRRALRNLFKVQSNYYTGGPSSYKGAYSSSAASGSKQQDSAVRKIESLSTYPASRRAFLTLL